jgi:hypothetical protein
MLDDIQQKREASLAQVVTSNSSIGITTRRKKDVLKHIPPTKPSRA